MGLALPADLEAHADGHDWHDPGVYALTLTRPDDMAAAWDRHFDTRPDWYERLVNAPRVCYVGASKDVLGRLEDHRDGEVRRAALLKVCDIDGLLTVVWTDTPFDDEYNVARRIEHEHPRWYVHQR